MTVILGAGISGISASYHLSKKDIQNIIFEQDNDWGGLCGNFEIDGFRFDKAVHLSFSDNEYVKDLFSKSCDCFIHEPIAYNYYNGSWLKHLAPNGCSSLQFEIYFSKDKPLNLTTQELINHIIKKSKQMNIFDIKDIVVQDCRILKYGNVIFYHEMENDRKVILDYLESLNIKTIGRFGKWEYLWSDQSLLSGIL
ncbi:MAG: NAD(P)-binding protein [Campylobacter sp.]|nr:NAD(P)-binding protein [Campylobacter sp.]